MTPKRIGIIGAGGRGQGFASLIKQLGTLGQVVAVAEPREAYRQKLVDEHGIPAGNVFARWEEFVKRPKLCDAVVIATMDREHVGPAVACLQLGYDLLLEKPMATTLEDCQAIERAQRKSGAVVGVCHSLRYHRGFRKVRDLVAGGAIGRLITVDLLEQVAHWHQVHSFVRGNWGNESRSTFMLMAKSCHDIDYLAFLVGLPCRQVSSFGRLSYFRREQAPAGSTERCTEDCPVEPTCVYSAIRQYVQANRTTWPAYVVSSDHSEQAHLEAIRKGPYGRCAWKCDNDVVDHQVVNLLYDQDVTATFTMTAFTQRMGRRLRAHGTKGELAFDEDTITVKTFEDGLTQQIQLGQETGGHGGGDMRVTRDWLLALHSRDDSGVVANAQESLRSHTIVFAAERARRENRVVALSEMGGS